MDIDLPQETEEEPPDSNYTIIQRLAGLLAGGLAVYSFFTPYVRATANFSLDVLGYDIASYLSAQQWNGTLLIGEYVGWLSYASSIDGNVVLVLAGGGTALIVAGALTDKMVTALGGIMTIGGAGLIVANLSSTTMMWLGGTAEMSIALEPAFGVGLLGGSGLIALFSLQL